jgi:deoxycytidylate deaminase
MGRDVISVGFNGFPKWMPDKTDHYANREEKYSRIVHCEVNALIHAKQNLMAATLYTYPFLSCDRCAVQMLQAGVMRFVAPKATPEQLERWGPAFERTRRYIRECGTQYLEIDLSAQTLASNEGEEQFSSLRQGVLPQVSEAEAEKDTGSQRADYSYQRQGPTVKESRLEEGGR